MKIEKEGELLSLSAFEKLTGAKWVSALDFTFSDLVALSKESAKLQKKGKLSIEQLWLGNYFKQELQNPHFLPDVVIRWINPAMGWGVFALRPFKKNEFIAEYTGKLRKKKKEDGKNSYCFEYNLAPGLPTRYTIDAQDQGALSRYINHSASPNLLAALATYQNVTHVILVTNRPIAKDEQLCYDYGADYWSKRGSPLLL